MPWEHGERSPSPTGQVRVTIPGSPLCEREERSRWSSASTLADAALSSKDGTLNRGDVRLQDAQWGKCSFRKRQRRQLREWITGHGRVVSQQEAGAQAHESRMPVDQMKGCKDGAGYPMPGPSAQCHSFECRSVIADSVLWVQQLKRREEVFRDNTVHDQPCTSYVLCTVGRSS